jgi:ABC-type nickel/cobalt efflux system permease component RcnA
MGGLDGLLAGLSDGATLPLVLLVAVLLGLRHATDPDHIAAVTAFVAGGEEGNAWAGASLGFAWGVGHGLTLIVLGTPLILFGQALPVWAERIAEVLVGLVIIALAVRLLWRCRAGAFHVHKHTHEGRGRHAHLHSHGGAEDHLHPHHRKSALGVLCIGIAHGAGGSAGVGILLVASIHSQPVAVAALVLLATGTAAAMTALSGVLGLTLFRWRSSFPAAPLGAASFAFGVWYFLGALSLVPYV